MKCRYAVWKKVFAAVGAVLLASVFAATLVGFLHCVMAGYYAQKEWDYYKSDACRSLSYFCAEEIAQKYYPAADRYEFLQDEFIALKKSGVTSERLLFEMNELYATVHQEEVRYLPENTNWRFVILRNVDECFRSTYSGEEYGYFDTYSFVVPEAGGTGKQTIQIDCYVVKPMTVSDGFFQDSWRYKTLYDIRYYLVIVLGLTFLGVLALSIYLIFSAGHAEVDGKERLVKGGLHRIPFDVLTVIVAAALAVIGLLGSHIHLMGKSFFNLEYISESMVFRGIVIGIVGGLSYGILLFYAMSMAIRAKTRTLLTPMLSVKGLTWLGKQIREIYREKTLSARSILWISVLGTVSLLLFSALIKPEYHGYLVLIVLVMAVFAVVLINLYQRQRRRLGKELHRIAEGEIDHCVNEDLYRGELRYEARDLNRIGRAVRNAVEERTKSERMKTDLITNVSHDVKTPLTNIINYCGLLEKEGGYSETQQQYLKVLDEQSKRLKKLIEDLIEASKATSGSIKPKMAKLDVAEMIRQITGEYSDRLKENGLELIDHLEDQTAKDELPPEAICIMVDGELLYRVMDNLFSNTVKYSQHGTRVYLDAFASEENVKITLRNISGYPLHLSGEELTARFVRDDSSRHSEGSGLGLSIAQSLTQLMNGSFTIEVDGDLFKVILSFPRL